MPRERVVSAEDHGSEEQTFNLSLRPTRFDQYIGQPKLIKKLRIAVQAALQRSEPVEHVLLDGPPGLGKTTLAHVISNEVGSHVYVTSGPALTRAGDLAGILTKLQRADVLFIDEIHRMPKVVEEYLYPAMEDFRVEITLDQGLHARTVSMSLEPFTLIGATTRSGLLTGAMRSRFGIQHHIEFYDAESLQQIIQINADRLTMTATTDALAEISRRSRGTPRIANRLLRRVRDFSAVESKGKIDAKIVHAALELEGIDELGLDDLDRAVLRTLIDVYKGGPAGIEAIAATLGEERDTLEEVVEPYLLQLGMIMRTRQGRRTTQKAYKHLNLDSPTDADEGGLFG